MKRLIISDLDGTLLAPSAKLDERALELLSKAECSFTFATARTAATVVGIMNGVSPRFPAVLMNGAVMYDLSRQAYTRVEYLGGAYGEAVSIIHSLGLAGFVYTVENGRLHSCYESLNSPNAGKFVAERVKRYGKVFERIDDFSSLKGAVYYSISDREDRLRPAYSRLTRIEGLNVEYYRDVYDKDFFYLELCAATASKLAAVNALRTEYGFDYIVGIGDNLNDLPLFAACDYKIAVSTAREEVKAAADEIIEYENGVGAARVINRFQ